MSSYSVSWCNVFSQTHTCERARDGREADASSGKDSVVGAGLLAALSLIRHNRAPPHGKFLYDTFLDNMRVLFFSWRKKGSAFPFDERWLTTDWLIDAAAVSHPRWGKDAGDHLSCSFSSFCIVLDSHHRGSEEVAFNKLFQGLGWFWGFGLERPYKGVKTQTCYFISIYSQESRPQSWGRRPVWRWTGCVPPR